MGQTSPYIDGRISPVSIVGSGTRIDHISAVLTAESSYGSEWCQTKQSTSPYVDARISPVGIVGSGTRIDHISAVLTAESSYGSEWCQTKQSVDARNSPVGTIFELITL
ncbi:hypothetical protein J6590_053377 [Homalodisca vitripennis]|nr:hypothetical protein J6590_053377 [Homalodisca vitripennis]